MEIERYIRKIVDDGDRREMEELSDILVEVVDIVKKYDEDCYREYKMKLYEMAYGKVLTDDLKREWVMKMRPNAKWTEEQVRSATERYGIEVPYMSAFVIINMLYSDMKSALGTGDDEESLNRYLRATNDWYFDEDVKVDGEEKLYNYRYYIVK